jgi:acyl-CoA hydrolase
MDYSEEYKRKIITAEEAAGLVRSGMWLDYGSILSFPSLIDEELSKLASLLEGARSGVACR